MNQPPPAQPPPPSQPPSLPQPPPPSVNPYEFLRISRNPDGSLTRSAFAPLSPPTGDQASDSSSPALSKDLPLNPILKTWLRFYIPNPPSAKKLPIIINFHGGGFILFSAATAGFHDCSAQMSASLPAVILSVEYSLAPENRLPAAYDDAVDALLWARDQALRPTDPWFRDYVDFSRCYLMGGSSGGNIAYHAGLRALDLDLEPLKLDGLILNQPFFGGEERTESEERMANDQIIPLTVTDLMWKLSLPVGADRDHEYCNPMLKMGMGKGKGKEKKLARCLVRGCVGDPLIDRQREFARTMEREGVSVVARLEAEGHHGIELFNPVKLEEMVADVRSFVYNGGGSTAGLAAGAAGAQRL